MTNTRPFLVQFAVAMTAYVVAVIISSVLLASLADGPLRTFCALIPIVPMIVVAITVVRQVRQLDELARTIHLEGLAIAFVGTALITFSYGFLETAGFPRLSMFFVWPLLASLWALGTCIGWRRYR
ncbi:MULTISPECIES: hypothetical protein [unclassified Pseudomonas]|jgi:hypothetical protein|uniref:hypothetical protein n=1 Tax=unclassified Pseudomonas TaxID=196821 RepID=UPI00177EEB90|nr:MULTISPECIES: hypothetical protein [unclassified Pseudomonas]MBD9655797.1 hypothetical protein [Pseudomonas sp. PDM12]CAH0306902.1 hypothetical protein SRABI70_04572 [Pseudomonas sp. Bi70]